MEILAGRAGASRHRGRFKARSKPEKAVRLTARGPSGAVVVGAGLLHAAQRRGRGPEGRVPFFQQLGH